MSILYLLNLSPFSPLKSALFSSLLALNSLFTYTRAITEENGARYVTTSTCPFQTLQEKRPDRNHERKGEGTEETNKMRIKMENETFDN
jgi:hypothetical protein